MSKIIEPALILPELVLKDEKISVKHDLSTWIGSIKAKVGGRIIAHVSEDTTGLDRYVECVEVQEIRGTFLCCAFYQQDMNDMLTRLGIFMGAGKGQSTGTVLPHHDFTLVNYKKLVAGHNLPGPVVKGFFTTMNLQSNESSTLNPFENVFQKNFVDSSRVKSCGESFYVIGFSIQNMKSYQSIVSHEILHAHYFLNPQFKSVIDKFWRDTIVAGDREQITAVIGRSYNTENEELVIDEFQAYLLQDEAHHDRMKDFVPRYRQPLLDSLSGVYQR